MNGSLESPPIIIRTSRIVSLIGLVICITILYSQMRPWLRLGAQLETLSYVHLLPFGIFSAYFCWQLLLPSSLIASPDGLTWKTSFKSRHWAWKDISNFRVVFGCCVGCDLSDDRPAVSWLRAPNKALSGSQGSFLFGWEGGTASVVTTLNAARSRWL
jgi:hypothetical protein